MEINEPKLCTDEKYAKWQFANSRKKWPKQLPKIMSIVW